MNQQLTLPVDPERIVRERFEQEGLAFRNIERRDYPDETIVVVHVPFTSLEAAATLGNRIDRELQIAGFAGFVVVRPTEDEQSNKLLRLDGGVADQRAQDLINLLTARSRTSEIQPSLSYVRDSAQNVLRAVTQRHHLIFGRRGAGKTALMVETKKNVEAQGQLTAWINLQTHRQQGASATYLWIAKKILDVAATEYQGASRAPAVLASIASLSAQIDSLIDRNDPNVDVG